MQLPSTTASSEVSLDHTDNFEGAVEGWSDAEIITAAQRDALAKAAAIVDPAAKSLRNALALRIDAERKATKLRARYLIRDIILDMRVMGASDAVLNGPAMRNRQSPVFKGVFQEGNAGEITESPMRDEPEVAARVLARLGAIDDFEGKARAFGDLDQAVKTSLATRDALDAAEMAENKAGDEELQARLGVRLALEQAYGLLRAAFPGQRKLVESFFLRRDRSREEGRKRRRERRRQARRRLRQAEDPSKFAERRRGSRFWRNHVARCRIGRPVRDFGMQRSRTGRPCGRSQGRRIPRRASVRTSPRFEKSRRASVRT